MGRFKKLLIASVVGIVVFSGQARAPEKGREMDGLRPLPLVEVNRIVASGVLPYSLEALAGYLRETVVYDRPELKTRLARLLQAYGRYQSETDILKLLEESRGNVRALYDLQRQRQRKQEVEDTAVIEARNRYLAAERVVVDQRKTLRLILLELLDTVNLIEVGDNDGTATARASGGADTR